MEETSLAEQRHHAGEGLRSTAADPSKSFLYKLKYYVKDWCIVSTIHSVPKLATTKFNILRVIWAVLTLASLGYMLYVIITNLIAYFQVKLFFIEQGLFHFMRVRSKS